MHDGKYLSLSHEKSKTSIKSRKSRNQALNRSQDEFDNRELSIPRSNEEEDLEYNDVFEMGDDN